MTDLNKITKEVSPTSLKELEKIEPKSLDLICEEIISQFKFNVEDTNKFNEGIGLEKLNRNVLLKMIFEIIVNIIDSSKKQYSGDTFDDALFIQNKKMVKDLTFSLFSVLNNFNYNDKQYKIFFLGKLVQSLYGNR